MSSTASDNSGGYYSAIDGLRALAVIAVLLYHHDIAWLPGGYLGVEIFFVISGFIITMQLARRWEREARVDYPLFLLRRGFRLLPGMVAMIVATWLVVALWWPTDLQQLRADTPASLTFLQNWNLLYQNLSYFEAMGRPRLLQHLWSLGVEFQFYLAWPLACVAVFRLPRRVQALAVFLLAGAAYLWMAELAGRLGDGDPSRAYLATDTRVGAILLGSALALMLRNSPRPATGAAVSVVGALALVGVCAELWLLEESHPWLYHGGLAVVALGTATAIGSLFLRPRGPVAVVLGSRPFTAIGVRAYSLYLWHWPVFCLTQANVDVPLDGVPLFIFRLMLTAVLSELSYSVVEMPFRDGHVQAGLRAMWCDRRLRPGVLAASGLYSGLGCILGVALLTPQTLQQASTTAGAIISPPVAAAEVGAFGQPEGVHEPAPVASHDVEPVPGGAPPSEIVVAMVHPTDAEPRAETPVEMRDPSPAREPRRSEPARQVGCFAPVGAAHPPFAVTRGEKYVQRMFPRDYVKRGVYAVGDSVMLGAVSALDAALGDADIDAKVGRQLTEALPLLRERIARGVLSDVVVIHLGNNGPFREAQLDDLLDLLRDVPQVVLVNLKLPRSYERRNNELLSAVVADPRVRLVDWRAASLAGKGVFGGDGIHLTAVGAQLYARLIAAAVCPDTSP